MVFVGRPVRAPVHRGPLLLALLATATFVLSGCSGPRAEANAGPQDAVPAETMTIVGLVQNATFAPVSGAHVAVRMTDHTATTDAGGLFSFTGLPLGIYLVDVSADGFANATLSAEPRLNVSLSFVLVAPAAAVPEPVTTHFTGYFQCAFEALIIPGSCDFFLNGTGQDVFEDQSTFTTGLGPAWSTAVIDVDFDGQPGLDGLRVTLRAKNDADQLGTYEEYGKFHGPESFSFRVEPEQVLPEGDRPIPANMTSLQLDVYPQGHGWHALCSDPVPPLLPAGSCPLGAGAAQNVQFDLYVTVFFVDPAPDGFTLLS